MPTFENSTASLRRLLFFNSAFIQNTHNQDGFRVISFKHIFSRKTRRGSGSYRRLLPSLDPRHIVLLWQSNLLHDIVSEATRTSEHRVQRHDLDSNPGYNLTGSNDFGYTTIYTIMKSPSLICLVQNRQWP